VTPVSVDAEALSLAIPLVVELAEVLDTAARQLGGIDIPAGVPGPLAARAAHTMSAGRRELIAAAHAIDPIPSDLLRRIRAAQQAQAPWLIASSWTVRLFKLSVSSFTMPKLKTSMAMGLAGRTVLFDGRRDFAGGGVRGRWTAVRVGAIAAKAGHSRTGVPPGLAKGAKIAGKSLTGLGWGLTAYSNLTNPRLTKRQKVARTAATIATGTGVSIMAGAASGAAFGSAAGPLGALVGFGAGAAWSVADRKFGVSNAIGDAAADAAGTVGDAASDAAGALGDAGGAVAHEADKALGIVGL
jgi:hypothetical protein